MATSKPSWMAVMLGFFCVDRRQLKFIESIITDIVYEGYERVKLLGKSCNEKTFTQMG
jgi:hypothetical protein